MDVVLDRFFEGRGIYINNFFYFVKINKFEKLVYVLVNILYFSIVRIINDIIVSNLKIF